MHIKHLSEQRYCCVVWVVLNKQGRGKTKQKTTQSTSTYMHACMHACKHRQTDTHTHFFLPPCTASGESSLYSRHREMSAPCDRPVSSSHTDLCGTSQLLVSPLMETMHACSLLGRFTKLIMGDWCENSEERSREKSPCCEHTVLWLPGWAVSLSITPLSFNYRSLGHVIS